MTVAALDQLHERMGLPEHYWVPQHLVCETRWCRIHKKWEDVPQAPASAEQQKGE